MCCARCQQRTTGARGAGNRLRIGTRVCDRLAGEVDAPARPGCRARLTPMGNALGPQTPQKLQSRVACGAEIELSRCCWASCQTTPVGAVRLPSPDVRRSALTIGARRCHARLILRNALSPRPRNNFAVKLFPAESASGCCAERRARRTANALHLTSLATGAFRRSPPERRGSGLARWVCASVHRVTQA